MMSLFIDCIYLVVSIVIFPYYLLRFITTPSSRLGLAQRFGFVPKRPLDKPAIWLHGASVGELKSAEVLIEKLIEKYPQYDLILSSLTPTAHGLLRKKYPTIHSVFFPFDFSGVVRRSLKRIKPDLIILLEQEIWPNFITFANRMNTPILLINGRITTKSYGYYRFLRWIFKPVLNRIKYLIVQDEVYRQRYETLGVVKEKIMVTGNMKYDNLPKLRISNSELRIELGIKESDIVLIGGSTHSPEEEVLIDTYRNLQPEIRNLRLIMAPRHPERFGEVENLIKARGFKCIKRSAPKPEAGQGDSTIILLDTIGELSHIYSIATVVFVGGSLVPKGGHNILEPVALGKPVFFGSYIYNFQESADILIKAGAGFMVHNKEELTTKLKNLLTDLPCLSQIGRQGVEIIIAQQGATERNMKIISNYLAE